MEKNTLNKLFAVHVMGLVEGVDFGKWEAHEWKTKREVDPDDYEADDPEGDQVSNFAVEYDNHNGPQCKRCSYYYCIHCAREIDNRCEQKVPDYTAPIWFQRVMNKLQDMAPHGANVSFSLPSQRQVLRYYHAQLEIEGDGIYYGGGHSGYEEALVSAILRWKGATQ